MESRWVRNSGWTLALWHGAEPDSSPELEVTTADLGEPWLHIASTETALVIGPAGNPTAEHVRFAAELAAATADYARQIRQWAGVAGPEDSEPES